MSRFDPDFLLGKLYWTYGDPREVRAVHRLLLEVLDQAMRDGEFDEVNALLARVDLRRVHDDLWVALLVAVYPARLKLPAYAPFFARVLGQLARVEPVGKPLEILRGLKPVAPRVCDCRVPDGMDLDATVRALRRSAYVGAVTPLTTRMVRVEIDPAHDVAVRLGL